MSISPAVKRTLAKMAIATIIVSNAGTFLFATQTFAASPVIESYDGPTGTGVSTPVTLKATVSDADLQDLFVMYELYDTSFTQVVVCETTAAQNPIGNTFSFLMGSPGPNWTCSKGGDYIPVALTGYFVNVQTSDPDHNAVNQWFTDFSTPTFTMGAGGPPSVPEFSTWLMLATMVGGLGLAWKMKPQTFLTRA